ncbi:hypothetical protein MPSEU_000847300 [Mayamaea pseudoterrestris]|nr:hypothetical protein MPSEU_000847300 [Mayamaea pseudoterrestris]
MSIRRNLLYSFLVFVLVCFLLQLTRLHAVTIHPSSSHHQGGTNDAPLYSIMGYHFVDVMNDPCIQRKSLAISSNYEHPAYSADQTLSLALCRAWYLSTSVLWSACEAIHSIACDARSYNLLWGRRNDLNE